MNLSIVSYYELFINRRQLPTINYKRPLFPLLRIKKYNSYGHQQEEGIQFLKEKTNLKLLLLLLLVGRTLIGRRIDLRLRLRPFFFNSFFVLLPAAAATTRLFVYFEVFI